MSKSNLQKVLESGAFAVTGELGPQKARNVKLLSTTLHI